MTVAKTPQYEVVTSLEALNTMCSSGWTFVSVLPRTQSGVDRFLVMQEVSA